MTNDQTAMLARYGIDYAEAMERFCGNESLFARIAEEPGRVGTFDLNALAGIEAEAPTLSPSHGRTARSSRLRPIQCPPR